LSMGFLTGVGSILYCFSLDYLPVSLVVTLSNLYIVITIVLGIVVLHEPVTVLKIAGLTCIVAGGAARALTRPLRGTSRGQLGQQAAPSPRVCAMGIYIVMIGVGAFLEKPALKGLAATQLNALVGIAMTAAASTARAVKGPLQATPQGNGRNPGICCSHQTTFPAGVRREPHRWDRRLTI